MLLKHQMIINCGSQENFVCQLDKSGSQSINIQAQQSFTQYNYYLLFNNCFDENCQVNLQAQAIGEERSANWSKVSLKIYYQNQELFAGSLTDFLSKTINLLNISGRGSKLYRLEFYLGELKEEFQINFDINFHLNCQTQLTNQEKKTEVLGLNTEHKEIKPSNLVEESKTIVQKQRLFLLLILVSFLFLLFLILFFFRSKLTRAKKYKLAQRKENL